MVLSAQVEGDSFTVQSVTKVSIQRDRVVNLRSWKLLILPTLLTSEQSVATND